MRAFFLALLVLLLSACTTTQVGALYQSASKLPDRPRDIWITIDGTGNSPISRTNASKLFEIVDAGSGLARERELATYYAEGVGSEGGFLGLAVGYGMSEDIRNAYTFLTQTYRPGDRIFLSGFSRGAYGVRVLAGMIAVAGIPNLSGKTKKERREVVNALFRAYKTGQRRNESEQTQLYRRIDRVNKVYTDHDVTPGGVNGQVRIEAMAIWDTVEALGWPDGTERPDEKVDHYYVTNCNIDHIYHALALDDNRSFSFTPIFVSGPSQVGMCENQGQNTHIEEVWFAGAHADVGGSYAPDDLIHGYLPGVSLNWMLDKMAHHRFYPEGTRVFADQYGPIHDARGYSIAYKGLTRHFRTPLQYDEWAKVEGLPRVHVTAIDRLAVAKKLDGRYAHCSSSGEGVSSPDLICGKHLENYGFVRELLDKKCLDSNDDGYILKAEQTCIEVVHE